MLETKSQAFLKYIFFSQELSSASDWLVHERMRINFKRGLISGHFIE